MQEQIEKPTRKLTRQEKKDQKYERTKLKNKRVRKKIMKSVQQKIRSLDPALKEQYYEIQHNAEVQLKNAYENGIPVFIDMDYDVLMSDREIRSLSLQVSHIMGINKQIANPIQLHLTNVRGMQKAELEKQGLSNWMVHQYEEGIQDIIESKKIMKEFIYLSPDAEEYLENVDPIHCVYIIGGFVDRQVQKYMSLNKANVLQICSRKLPIEQFIKGQKRPLNIDRVASILSLYSTHKDWQIAYEKSGEFNVSLVERMKANIKQSELLD